MKQVLLSGGAGFVGANLARRLLAEGHRLHVLARPGANRWRLDEIRQHIELHDVDLADEEAVSVLCERIRPEWIFHLAAHGAYSSQTDLLQMVQTNIVGTVNLVKAVLRIGFDTFVHAGTSSEYGFKDHGPRETEAIEPNSAYAATKASATLICGALARRHRARIQTLRLYSVYGPYEEPSRLMPTLIVRGMVGALPPLVQPEIARDYVYTEDVNDAFLRVAQCPDQECGAVYNVGTGVQTSIAEVVGLARRILSIQPEPVWGSMPDRDWDTTEWVANTEHIRARLGWQPRYTLEKGFEEMVRWFRDDPRRRQWYSERETERRP